MPRRSCWQRGPLPRSACASRSPPRPGAGGGPRSPPASANVARTTALRRLVVTGVIALLVFGFFETVPFAVSCLLLMPSWLPSVLVAMALLGLSIVWVNVGVLTLIQRPTPSHLLGRVDAALTVATTVPQAASIALGAALIAVVDYRVLLAVLAAIIVLSAIYLVSRPDTSLGGPVPTAAAVLVPDES
jgi:hypothetical protein